MDQPSFGKRLCLTLILSAAFIFQNVEAQRGNLAPENTQKSVGTLDGMGKLYDPNCHQYVKSKDYIRLGQASSKGKTPEQLYMDLDQRTERFINWGSYAGKNARGLTFDYLNLIKSEKVKAEANAKYTRWSPFAPTPDMTYCDANPNFNQCLAFQVYCTQQMVVRGMGEALKTTEDQINHCTEDYNGKNKHKKPADQCNIDKLSNSLRWLKEHAVQLFQVAENALAMDPRVKDYFDEASKTFIKYIGDLQALKAAQAKAIEVANNNIKFKAKEDETKKIINNCKTLLDKDDNDVKGHDVAGKLMQILSPNGCDTKNSNNEIVNLAADLDKISLEVKSNDLDKSINREALKNTAKALWGTYKLFMDKGNTKDLVKDKKYAIDELLCKYGKNDKHLNPAMTQKDIDALNKAEMNMSTAVMGGSSFGMGTNINSSAGKQTLSGYNQQNEKYFKGLPDFCIKNRDVLNEAHDEFVKANSISPVEYMTDDDTKDLLDGEFAGLVKDIETQCKEINNNNNIINAKINNNNRPALNLNSSGSKFSKDSIPNKPNSNDSVTTISFKDYQNLNAPDSNSFSTADMNAARDYDDWNPYDNGEGAPIPKNQKQMAHNALAGMYEKQRFKAIVNNKFDNTYRDLIHSKLGHLLIDRDFQKIVGTKSYEDLYETCREKGTSGFKVPSLGEVNKAKKAFLALQNRELKDISKQLVDPKDKVQNIQKYLRNSPNTIAHLLQSNPSPEYAKNLCAFIRDINDDDEYWQTVKMVTAPVGLVAGIGLSITGIGAPAGAGILGWVAGAGLVTATSLDVASFARDIKLDEEGIRATEGAVATFQTETEDALKKIKSLNEDLDSAKFWLPMTVLFAAADIVPVSYARVLKTYGKTNRGKALYKFFKIEDVKALKEGSEKLTELQGALKKGSETLETLSKRHNVSKEFFKHVPQEDQFFLFGLLSKMDDAQADVFFKKLVEMDPAQIRKLIDNVATDAQWFSKGKLIGKTNMADLKINMKTLNGAVDDAKKFNLPNGVDAETYFSKLKSKLKKMEPSMDKTITMSSKAYSTEKFAESSFEGAEKLEKLLKSSGIDLAKFNKLVPYGEDYKLLAHYVNVLGEEDAKVFLRLIESTQDQKQISQILKAIDSNPALFFNKQNQLQLKALNNIIVQTKGVGRAAIYEVPDFISIRTLKDGIKKEEALISAMKKTNLKPTEMNELLLAHRGHLEMVPAEDLEDVIQFIARREELYSKGIIKSSKTARESVRDELDSILGMCRVNQ